MACSRGWAVVASAVVGLGFSGGAGAISGAAVDTFEGGSTAGWSSGAANPNAPVGVAGGGPAGAQDGFLRLTASGVAGPGGKLVAFFGPGWVGDYTAAGVTSIAMDLRNFGSVAVELRLLFDDGGGANAITTRSVVVAPGGGWVRSSFDIAPAALSGNAAALGHVAGLRLFHGVSASYPGQDIAAQIGVDNVTAVPEPSGAALAGSGLAGLLAWHARRRRRRHRH